MVRRLPIPGKGPNRISSVSVKGRKHEGEQNGAKQRRMLDLNMGVGTSPRLAGIFAPRSELSRIGGRRKRFAPENTDPLPKSESAMAVRDDVAQLLADVYVGKLNPRIAAGLAPLPNQQLGVIETTDLEQRLEQVEKQLTNPDKDFDSSSQDKVRFLTGTNWRRSLDAFSLTSPRNACCCSSVRNLKNLVIENTFRSAPPVAEIDSAKRRSVRPPSAIAPIRCHVRCCDLRARAKCERARRPCRIDSAS